MIKKVIYLFIPLALLCGCEHSEDLGTMNKSNLLSEVPEVLYASMADENDHASEGEGANKMTRTYVDDKSVLWHSGDAVSYFASSNHNVKYQYNGEDGASTADFTLVQNTGSVGSPVNTTYAVYPYSETTTCWNDNGVEKLAVTYPATQNYLPNSFGRGANTMVSAGLDINDNNLYFRNACGYLVLKLYGEGVKVKNIKLTALAGEKLSGKAHIVAKHDAAPIVDMDSETTPTVTLNCGNDGVALGADKGSATEFWFALPPVTLNKGFQIIVTDTEGRLFKTQTAKKVSITRNDIQPMAAIQFVNNIPANNQLWYTRKSGKEPLTFKDKDMFAPYIYHHYYDSEKDKIVITFNGNLSEIRDNAFKGTDITSIELPQSLRIIEENVFYQCTDLTSISIPGSVTNIGCNAFYECTSLRTVNFEEGDADLNIGCGYTSILESLIGPFYYSPLTSITFNREMVYKDKYGDNLTATDLDEGIFCKEEVADISREEVSVTIGGKVKTIPNYMFAYLRIRSLVIPGNVTKIGNNVFEKCVALKSVKFLPDSKPLTIGYIDRLRDLGTFYYSRLEVIDLDRELDYANDGPGGLDAWDEGIFAHDGYGETAKYDVNVTLGPNVKTIWPWMFAGVRNLKNIWIPREITSIGEGAFWSCPHLKSLTCNHTTPPTLGEDVFDWCYALSYIIVLEESEEAFKTAPGWSDYASMIRTWKAE